MDTMILQVPMSKTLKKQAEAVASDYGFSSLQESIRLFVRKLADRTISIDITPTQEHVVLTSAARRRYAASGRDFQSKKRVHRVTSSQELIDQLHED